MKQTIRRFVERFEVLAMAVAFAEAGEWTTAEHIMSRKKQNRRLSNEKKSQRKPRVQNRMQL